MLEKKKRRRKERGRDRKNTSNKIRDTRYELQLLQDTRYEQIYYTIILNTQQSTFGKIYSTLAFLDGFASAEEPSVAYSNTKCLPYKCVCDKERSAVFASSFVKNSTNPKPR